MRRIWIAALALAVVVSANRADDKAKTDAPPGATKTPAQQFADLEKQFNVDFQKVLTEFRDAKADEREKVKERAFKLAPDYAKKFMALVEENPKDPIAVKSLMWIATVSGSRGVPPPPQAKEAFERLIRDYFDSPAMADLCPMLEGHPQGEKALRQIREKNPSKHVKALAAVSLANVLGENPKPNSALTAEIESLYSKAIDESQGLKEFPEEKRREAEGNLFEIRYLSVGKAAPNIESVNLDGKRVELSELRGKVVVLDIWTTWCGPCKRMIPGERELVKKLEGKPFVLVSISADAEKDTLTKFIEKEPMPWTHWWNGARGGILEKWNVKFFPTIYVIDAKGTIRHKNIHDKELDEAVEALVKETEEKK
jgi:thiol-disulfide isomerase/thioredoxin